jgi:hypothetical protein
MNPIGGFFELETGPGNSAYHSSALALTSGRACLSAIIQSEKISKVYAPFYTCNALLEPFLIARIKVEFYALNDKLELKNELSLKKNERIIYINYFGLKNVYAASLIKKYNSSLILDNTMAFFEKGNSKVSSFNSARKFFGCADGAYLYSSAKINNMIPRNADFIFAHLINRHTGLLSKAYKQYLLNEKKITCDVLRISVFSEKILAQINYRDVIQKRKSNFKLYHQKLSKYNQYKILPAGSGVPFCYPFLSVSIPQWEKFYDRNIFIPCLWDDVIKRRSRNFKFEKQFAQHLIPLPVDHRYSPEEINFVIQTVKQIIL